MPFAVMNGAREQFIDVGNARCRPREFHGGEGSIRGRAVPGAEVDRPLAIGLRTIKLTGVGRSADGALAAAALEGAGGLSDWLSYAVPTAHRAQARALAAEWLGAVPPGGCPASGRRRLLAGPSPRAPVPGQRRDHRAGRAGPRR